MHHYKLERHPYVSGHLLGTGLLQYAMQLSSLNFVGRLIEVLSRETLEIKKAKKAKQKLLRKIQK